MDDFPKCHVCQQHFTLKGPSPYLLPCLHAVCDPCVTSTAGGVISCSTCQREVNLRETHLQKDVVRQKEIFHLTVQHRPSELLCTHEDDGNQAVCWCQECEEFLCEHCHTLHESFKATRRHAVQEIADIQPGVIDQEEYCSVHKTRVLDFWDQECNILICARCRRGDHADHEVVDIDVAAESAKTEIVTREKEVQQVGVHHNSLLDTTTKQLKSMSETSNTLRDKICHTSHSLKALLEQRENELLITLQRRTDETKVRLDSKINVAQFSHSRCKMTSEYIQKARLYSSKYDLLRIKKTIGETTQRCIHSAPPEEQEDLPLPMFNTEGLDRLKSSLSSFGEITTLKDLSNQTQMYQEKATQAGAEYLAKLEEMENRNKMKLKQLEDDLKTSQSTVEKLQTVVKAVTRQKEEAERDAKGADKACKKSIDERYHLEKEVFTHKETIKSLESSVEDYKNKMKRLETSLEKATQAGAEYLAKLEEMENRNKMKLKQLEDDLKTSQSTVEKLQTVVKAVTRQKEEAERDAKGADKACKKSIDERKHFEKEVFTHKETIKSLESSVEDYKNKMKRLETSLEKATQAGAEYLAKLEEMENRNKMKLKQLEDDLKTSQSTVEKLQTVVKAVTRQKEEAERDAKGADKTCKKSIDERKHFEKEVFTHKETIKSLESSVEDYKNKMKRLETSLEKATQAGAEYLAKLEEMENRNKMKLKQLEDDLKTSQSTVEKLQTVVKAVTRQKEEAERDAKGADKTCKKSIDERKHFEKEVFTHKETIKSLESSVEDYKNKMKRLETSLEKATQAGAEYLAKLEEMENRNKMKLKQLEDDLKTSKSTVEKLQTVVKAVTRQKEEAERDAKGADKACKKSIEERKQFEKEVFPHKETIKSLESSVEDYKNKMKRLETLLGLLPDSYHLLTNSILLQCIHLKYDLDRVNLSKAHIDNNGVLVNKAGEGPHGYPSRRFQKYSGTTSTVPLPQTGHLQYMEVVVGVGIDKPLIENNLVLELGVCREEEMDVMHCIPYNQYCYSLYVLHCPHHSSVCTGVMKDWNVVYHVSDTLPNTVGSHTTLHYGMVYDSNRKVIVFIDVKGMKIIKVLDNVNYDKPMWPMFTVYAHDKARISMKLVVGKDIDMTAEKKAMILEAL